MWNSFDWIVRRCFVIDHEPVLFVTSLWYLQAQTPVPVTPLDIADQMNAKSSPNPFHILLCVLPELLNLEMRPPRWAAAVFLIVEDNTFTVHLPPAHHLPPPRLRGSLGSPQSLESCNNFRLSAC